MSESGTREPAHGRLHHAKEIAAEEFRRFLIAFVYIGVVLLMFTVHEEIALRTHGGVSQAIPFLPHGFALVNALVLAKVAMIVEGLRLGDRLKPEPLIYPIVIDAVLLAALFLGMHVLEALIGGWIHGRSLALSVPAIAGGGAAGVIFAGISFFVAMLPFCAFRHITIAIGWKRMRQILFGRPAG